MYTEQIASRRLNVPPGTFDLADEWQLESDPTGGLPLPLVAVENPGGGRIQNKRDPARGDTVVVNGYRGRKVRLHRLAATAWQNMSDAARAAGFASPLLLPVSGYRSTARQRELFANAVKKYGSESKARRWVAKPGGSAHHSGRAIDLYLGYGISSRNVKKMQGTAVWRWLTQNAERFGFYPYDAEPWHWEYNPPMSAGAAMSSDSESSIFDTIRKLPSILSSTLSHGAEVARTAAAIANGNRDENSLTSELFYARHPERNRQKIDRSESRAIAEWQQIRDKIVRPLLDRVPQTSKTVATATRPAPAPALTGTPAPAAKSTPAPAPAITSTNVSFKTGGWGGWKGLSSTPSLARIQPSSVSGDLAIAVAATSAVEGAFDKVQTYDRGILSWGIKQWTLHAGSLQKLLGFIQQSLASKGQRNLWEKLFPGLNIQGKDVWYKGSPYVGEAKLMQLIRGGTSKTSFDKNIMESWMRRFVLAGRDPAIQALQLEYAKKDLAETLKRNPRQASKSSSGKWRFKVMPSTRTIGHYLGNDGRSIALFQSMYTQLPAWAMTYVGNVVGKLRKKYGAESQWPANWQSEFRQTFEEDFKNSGVACWGLQAKSGKSECRSRDTRYQKTVASLRRFMN